MRILTIAYIPCYMPLCDSRWKLQRILTTYRGRIFVISYNVVKECKNIYIEVSNCLDKELRMTIDAKKIIPKLSVPLEDTKWEKLKNMKWGTLIRETYGDIIISIGDFTEYARRILLSKTTEDMWWHGFLFKSKLCCHYYISRSVEGELILLPRAAF